MAINYYKDDIGCGCQNFLQHACIEQDERKQYKCTTFQAQVARGQMLRERVKGSRRGPLKKN